MAWAHVQTTGQVTSGTGTTRAATYAGAVTAGNTLVCAALWADNSTACTVSCTVNGAWTAIGTPTGSAGHAGRIQLFYFNNTAAGTPTVTMTTGSNVYRLLLISEYSGLDTVAPVDAIPAGTGGATGSSTAPSSSLTTTLPNDMVYGAVYVTNSASVGAGFTLRSNLDGNGCEDTNQASAGTLAVPFVQSPTGTWVTASASFKEPRQEFLPDADTVTTGWTATPLYSKLNDGSDATVVTATLA